MIDYSLLTIEMEKLRKSTPGILGNYKQNILGLYNYYKNFGALAQSADEEQEKRAKDLIEDALDVDINDIKKLQPTKPGEAIDYEKIGITIDDTVEKFKKRPKEEIREISGQFLEMYDQTVGGNFLILSRSSFLMLNNYFEYLLSDLLSYYYNKFQSALSEKRFDLTLKEINEHESIKDAVKAFIVKEVESLMVELSFDKLLEHFDTKLKINKESDLVDWKAITEYRERRHLIVHNSSLVNKKYITRTGNPYKLKIGEVAGIDNEYFLKACDEFYLAGALLGYNCLGNWDKEYATGAIHQILAETVNFLNKGQYEVAFKLADYVEKRVVAANDDEEDIVLRIRFNKILALKHLGRKEAVEKALQKTKVGTAGPLFKLAHSILSDDYNSIMDLVKQAESIGDISIDDYLSWPIYKILHSIDELHKKILLLLGEEEVIIISEVDKTHKSTRRKRSTKAEQQPST